MIPIFWRNQTHVLNLIALQKSINSAPQHCAPTKLKFKRAFNARSTTKWINRKHGHNSRRVAFHGAMLRVVCAWHRSTRVIINHADHVHRILRRRFGYFCFAALPPLHFRIARRGVCRQTLRQRLNHRVALHNAAFGGINHAQSKRHVVCKRRLKQRTLAAQRQIGHHAALVAFTNFIALITGRARGNLARFVGQCFALQLRGVAKYSMRMPPIPTSHR